MSDTLLLAAPAQPDAATPSNKLTTAARQELVLLHQSRVRGLASKFWKAHKRAIDADELVGEALAALVEAANSYDPDLTVLPFVAYACQKVMWRLRDFMQSWCRLARRDYNLGEANARMQMPLRDVEAVDERAVEPLDQLHTLDLIAQVGTLLTPEERHFLDLRFRDNRNLREISQRLHISHSTARKLYVRVIHKLRAALAPAVA